MSELPMTLAGIGGRDKSVVTRAAGSGWAVGVSQESFAAVIGRSTAAGGHCDGAGQSAKLLLADEPTGELDTATSDEVMALLRQMNVLFGVTVIIVTHDPRGACRRSRCHYSRWAHEQRNSAPRSRC